MSRERVKSKVLVLLLLFVLLLSACSPKENVVEPELEPAEQEALKEANEQAEATGTPKKLTIADAVKMFNTEKYLRDYQEELETLGYTEPFKEFVLAETDEMVHMGLIYQVADGFAMFEHDPVTGKVLTITGYLDEKEIQLQEMKGQAYLKENEMFAETDEATKEKLQAEIDKMWEDISKLEQ